MEPINRGLGRLVPPDWEHTEKYPAARLLAASPGVLRPVAHGWPWYQSFYKPDIIDGMAFIGERPWGPLVGGHAIPSPTVETRDLKNWWRRYDQGEEGACAGFCGCRVCSWIDRVLFDGFDLYHRAQLRDGFGPPNPDRGTSMRAMAETLKDEGPKLARGKAPDPRYKISSFYWARSWDEVRTLLGVPASENKVEIKNSWGETFPFRCYVSDETGARLLSEDGEAMVLVNEPGFAP